MPSKNARRSRVNALCKSFATATTYGVVAAGFVLSQPGPAWAQFSTAAASAATTDAELRAFEREQEYAQLQQDVEALSRELGVIKRVVKLVTPTVVHVEASPLRENLIRSNVQEAGSGVIVRYDGRWFVLTNRHVIRHSSAPNIRIQLADGSSVNPERVWSDPKTDIAIMSLPPGDYIEARVGDSSIVEIGEQVLAVGSPFGLSQSVTRGIISAKGRYNLELGDGELELQNFLQTDAAINPGNSGGPLINLRGEVIGINTAIASNSGGNEGIGFSIPVDIAIRIAHDLVDRGEFRRGYLGVKLDSLYDERGAKAAGLSRLMGARVKSIEGGSPAATAALQPDDVIVTYAGTVIEDDNHFISLVQLSEVGRQVPLVIYRDHQPFQVVVQVGDLPAAK